MRNKTIFLTNYEKFRHIGSHCWNVPVLLAYRFTPQSCTSTAKIQRLQSLQQPQHVQSYTGSFLTFDLACLLLCTHFHISYDMKSPDFFVLNSRKTQQNVWKPSSERKVERRRYLSRGIWRGSWPIQHRDTVSWTRRHHSASAGIDYGRRTCLGLSAAGRWDTDKHWPTATPGVLSGLKAPDRQSWSSGRPDTSGFQIFSL